MYINSSYNSISKKQTAWDFPAGPVVKNLLSNAGNMSLIPGLRTKSHMQWGN